MATICISPTIRQTEKYKEIQKKYDLHESLLDSILSQYMEQEGNEEKFPPDSFIEQRLTGTPLINAADSQIQVWNEMYSTPIEVSENQLQAAKAEAISYFGEESVAVVQKQNGDYRIVVAEPLDSNGYNSEMRSIKEKAVADGTFIKAPNGKPTNLNERQWLQVRTKAFKDWFGDWINDKDNASKVVDENGEPMVAYHYARTKTFDVFDLSRTGEHWEESKRFNKPAAYFLPHKQYHEGEWGDYEIAVFLNIRYPGVTDRGKYHYSPKKYKEKIDGYVPNIFYPNMPNEYNMDEADKIAQEGLDSLYHGGYPASGDFVVFNPNQIKSATDNIGTFSLEENNIYQNKEIEIPQVAQTLVNNGLESLRKAGIIHRYNDSAEAQHIKDTVKDKKERNKQLAALRRKNKKNVSYYISKHTGPMSAIEKQGMADELAKYLSIQRQRIVQYLSRYNIPEAAISFEETNNAWKINIDNTKVEEQLNSLNDRIARNFADANFDTAFENKIEANNVRKILAFLSEKTGLSYEFISFKDAKKLNKDIDSNTNAFVKDNKVYFIQEKRLNTDIAAEEMLHPFVASIKILNDKAFNSLLADAKKAFPKLAIEIELLYTQNKDEELVTQALSRAFREDKADYPEGHPVKDLIRHFFEWARKMFAGLFWNGGLPETITADMFQENLTITDLAQIVNSELKLDSGYIEGIRENKTIEENEVQQPTRETLVITPIQAADKKATIKGRLSNKYIGFADGISGSSTAEYARQAGDKANVGVYSPEDTVFVSIPGMRGNAEIRHAQQDRTVQEALKALNQGATLITDNETYTNNSSYNEGEKRLAQALKNAGATYSEMTVDGQALGVWKLQQLTEEGVIYSNEVPTTPIEVAQHQFEEIKPIETKLSAAEQRFVEAQANSYRQRQNLEEAGLLSNEIADFAESVGFTLSDYITWIKEGRDGNLDWALKMFPNQIQSQEQLRELQGKSRMEIVEAVGLDNLYDVIKNDLTNPLYCPANRLKKVRALSNNWDAVMDIASVTFNNNEDFSIVKNTGKKELVETDKKDEGNQNDTYSDVDDMVENGNTIRESWQVHENTTDFITTIPKKLKLEISQYPELDANEKPLKNSWGHIKRRPLRKSVQKILDVVYTASDITDMTNKIGNALTDNPWLAPIYRKLTNQSGQFADFQSMFYTTFKEAKNRYIQTFEQDGKIVSKVANENQATKGVMKEVKTLFELGNHPLFTERGISVDGLSVFVASYDSFISHIDDVNPQQRSEALKIMIDLLSGSSELLAEYTDIVDLNNLNGQDLATIKDGLTYIKNTLQRVAKSGNTHYDPFEYVEKSKRNQSNSIYTNVFNVFKPFLKGIESETTNTAYVDGKTYQTDVVPSWLLLTLERFHDEATAFKFAKKMYGDSEWFMKDGAFRNYVLATFFGVSEEERKNLLVHSIEVDFNGKKYMQDMSPNEYTLSIIKQYFGNRNKGVANYPIPIQSNKPSNEFISFTKISGAFPNVMGNYYEDGEFDANDVIVFSSTEKPVGRQVVYTPAIIRGRDNADLWINNLIKRALAYPEVTYKITNMQNNLFTHKQMLQKLLAKPLPKNIKLSRTDALSFVSEAQKEIAEKVADIVWQEIDRIQTVKARKDAGIKEGHPDYLESFDENGSKFAFILALNDYYVGNKKNSKFGEVLNKVINKTATSAEIAEFEAFLKQTLIEDMANNVDRIIEQYKDNGVFQASAKLDGLSSNDSERENQLREMLWNHHLVSPNLMQLFTVDLAFYGNTIAVQKRMSQIHAPGRRVNVLATDYEGNRISDGFGRTIVLNDFKGLRSSIIENVREVFYKKLDAIEDKESDAYKSAKAGYDAIISLFEDVNLTDAQAYRSNTGVRKVGLMGAIEWSKAKDELYKKIMSGEYNHKDTVALTQVIKDFVFSHLTESSRVDAPIKTLKIPFQNKNSEYLITLAGAILQGEKTSRPNLLKVLNRVMEESAYDGREYDAEGNVINQGTYNGKGIDVVQFKSAVKVGAENTLNLEQFEKMGVEEGEEAAYAYLMANIYKTDNQRAIVRNPDMYQDNTVRKYSYEHWCVQQNIEDHFMNHEQLDGSQKRAIMRADLVMETPEGLPVTYSYKFGNETKQYNAKEFRQHYEDLYAKKIQIGIDKLVKELKLTGTQQEKNVAIAQILQKEIMSNISRYGLDLLDAFTLNENYEFGTSFSDPVIHKRIEQLLNAVMKNRVNKISKTGGLVVQVSNFGTSEQLHIRFNDKNGNPIQTLSEYLESNEGKTVDDYKKYIREEQAGIACMECYCSMYNDALVNYMNSDGIIDVAALEKENPDLLKMIGYRIPTEDKYSIMPLKIIGFLPAESGAGIMMPAEITLLMGSDFDVDKMDLQLKAFDFNFDKGRFQKEAAALLKNKYPNLSNKEITDGIMQFTDEIESHSEHLQTQVSDALIELYDKSNYISAKYSSNEEKKIDNELFDMDWAVLTHSTTADKMLNPGGFEREKKFGYVMEVFRNPENKKSFDELMQLSVEELKKMMPSNQDLCWLDTQVQFYQQHSSAAAGLSISAVQKSAHAMLEGDGLVIDGTNLSDFKFMGHTLGNGILLDMGYTKDGVLISKVLGEFVGMFADAAKDPVANYMNLNDDTVPLICTMVRMGIPFEDAAMLFSTKTVGNLIRTINDTTSTGRRTSFSSLVETSIREMEKEDYMQTSQQIIDEGLNKDELLLAIQGNETQEMDYKILKALQTVIALNEVVEAANAVTRLNSIASAVGPQLIDNVLFEEKLNTFTDYLYDSNGNQLSVVDLLNKHPMLKAFAQMYVGDGYYKQVFKNSVITEFAKSFILEVGENFNIGKDLLNKFVEYSLSDMLTTQGLIKFEGKKSKSWYEYEFPNEFFENEKKKYPDNPFVQSIVRSLIENKDKYNKTKKISSLKIEYLGLDETERQKLKNGWKDLDKVNPELSEDIYKYWYLRGGLSFTPITGMALLPFRLRQKYYGDNPSRVFSIEKMGNTRDAIVKFYLQNHNNTDLVKIVNKKTFKFEETEEGVEISTLREPVSFAFKIKGNNNIVYLYEDKYYDVDTNTTKYTYAAYDISRFDINENFINFADTFEQTNTPLEFTVAENKPVVFGNERKAAQQEVYVVARDIELLTEEHPTIETPEQLEAALTEEAKNQGVSEEEVEKINKETQEEKKKNTACD